MFFDTLVEKKNNNKKNRLFKDIMMDKYGNYIAYTIMETALHYHAPSKYFDVFYKTIQENLDQLRKVNFGK